MLTCRGITTLAWTAYLVFSASAVGSSDIHPARCSEPVNLTGNPFAGKSLFSSNLWRSNVLKSAELIQNTTLKSRALETAGVGTFLWLYNAGDIPKIEPALSAMGCDDILGLVLYNLPGRPFLDPKYQGLETGRLADYQEGYIDVITDTIRAHPNIPVAVIIEPWAIANMVTSMLTNPIGRKCEHCAREFPQGIAYAIRELSALPNVAVYIDAADGSWLGWNDNLNPAAKLIKQIFVLAGSPARVRGFATNVANYNAWSLHPGEFEHLPDSAMYNKAQDEQRFVHLFSGALAKVGLSNWHAIVDTSRNAVQGLRPDWQSSCNVNGAGLGPRSTTETGDDLTDAFVWVKNPGESDGTSDRSSVYYSSSCGIDAAFKPSPDAGVWNHAYFEMLLRNAKN